MIQNYEIVVIGAGSGGLVAAEFAAKLGASVALIEAKPVLGGECLHTGCVPSKALIHAARIAWIAGHSQHLGVKATPQVRYGQTVQHIAGAIKHITDTHDNDEYYTKLGVSMYHGPAIFVSSDKVQVGDHILGAKNIIIASGSRPNVPNISGLLDGPFLTNESIFDMQELPGSITVIGGGPIGCELGQAYAMLGTNVTIIQSGARLMPRDEAEAVSVLEASFKSMGIKVITDTRIEGVSYAQNGSVTVSLANGNNITSQKLLVATGRIANIPTGLETAGVNVSEKGSILVNHQLKTSTKHIYAIGDCNGGLQFTHAAAEQAIIAVQNALFGLRKQFNPAQIPWTTFTTPEIAHYGPLKLNLDSKKTTYFAIRSNFSAIDKAVAEAEDGYIEVLYDRKDHVIAATVVGANAAEILAQITMSKTIGSMGAGVQAYPTYAIGLKQLAANNKLDRFEGSRLGKMAAQYLRIRTRLRM